MTLAASAAFSQVPDLHPCGPTDGLGAVLAFEFARTPADVAALFGSGPCAARLAVAQSRALLVDCLLFIPAYTGFLVSAGFAVRPVARRTATAAMLAVVAAAMLDEVEGVLLWALLGRLPGTPELLQPLYWIVRAKFVLLALGTGLLGGALARRSSAERVAAVGVLGGAMMALWLALVAPRTPALMDGYRIAWTAILVIAALRLLRATFGRACVPAP